MFIVFRSLPGVSLVRYHACLRPHRTLFSGACTLRATMSSSGSIFAAIYTRIRSSLHASSRLRAFCLLVRRSSISGARSFSPLVAPRTRCKPTRVSPSVHPCPEVQYVRGPPLSGVLACLLPSLTGDRMVLVPPSLSRSVHRSPKIHQRSGVASDKGALFDSVLHLTVRNSAGSVLLPYVRCKYSRPGTWE